MKKNEPGPAKPQAATPLNEEIKEPGHLNQSKTHVPDSENVRLKKNVRAATLTVRVSDTEKRNLEAKADREGKPLSGFLRDLLIERPGAPEAGV